MACCDFDRLRALVCAGMEKVSVRWLVRELWRCARGRGRSASRARADTTVTERVRTASSAATAANSLLPPRPCWCNLVADTHCDCSLVEANSLSLLTFLFRPLLPTRYQALPLLPPRRNQHTHSRSPPPRRTHPPPLYKGIQTPRAAPRNPSTMAYMLYSIAFFVLAVGTSTHPHPCPIQSIPTSLLSRYIQLTNTRHPQHSTSPAPAGSTSSHASPPDPSTRACPPRSAKTSRPACTRPTST
jgi:hypothetical protein